jgi:arsenate reductase
MTQNSEIKIWHNPKCSKSREAVKVAEELGCNFTIIKYLETLPNASQLQEALKTLGINARELMRTTEAIYKELKLKDEMDERKLIDAMVNNPKLIQRPILFKNGKAIIGRPTSIVADFLKA